MRTYRLVKLFEHMEYAVADSAVVVLSYSHNCHGKAVVPDSTREWSELENCTHHSCRVLIFIIALGHFSCVTATGDVAQFVFQRLDPHLFCCSFWILSTPGHYQFMLYHPHGSTFRACMWYTILHKFRHQSSNCVFLRGLTTSYV